MATVNQKILNALDTYNTEKDVQLESTYVKQETGKGLSANDYTTTEKNKLAGIANNANNYSLPAATNSVRGGVIIGDNITNTSGTISISQANVTGALGYVPADKSTGTPTALGLSKLYTGTGSAVDGSMTQAAITTQLNTKANSANPTFTGTPKAPTAAAGTNSTQLATTEFVQAAKTFYTEAYAAGSFLPDKKADLPGFVLQEGAMIAIWYNGHSMGLNPTLNVNNTGAKQIMYRGCRMSPAYWKVNTTLLLCYDGTYWQVIGDLNFDPVDIAGNVWIPFGKPSLGSDYAAVQSAVICYHGAQMQMADSVSLGGSDFTVDFWTYAFADQITGAAADAFNARLDNSNRFHLYCPTGDGGLQKYLAWQLVLNGQTVFDEHYNTDDLTGWEQFMHHAFVYKHSEGKVYLFRNGVLKKTISVTIPAKSYKVAIGGQGLFRAYAGGNLSCAIDEFRISNCARWTENFDVPTETYDVDNNTVALCHFD